MFGFIWVCVAFLLGFLAREMRLPPLVGYLATGFLLLVMDVAVGPVVPQLSELGVTLLLFTIGLKLRLRGLLQPHVWGVALLHMLVITLALGGAIWGVLGGVGLETALLIGFALSFSSTVFAVKVLEEKGEMGSLYGQTAIGVLIIQDLVAVVFLALSAGKTPTWLAPILLVGLVPLRWALLWLLERAGHEELLILFGLAAAVGSYALFESVGMKGDLGALIVGALLAPEPKAGELAKTLLGLKDFFLVGFFISIGLTGLPSAEIALMALALVAMVPLKSALFYLLFTRFKLRSRSSFLASLGLSNFSEFGLIIAMVGVSLGWLSEVWLLTIALALAISFVLASPFNLKSHALYDALHVRLMRFQRSERLPDEREVNIGDATVLLFGMGRVGMGAYEHLVSHSDERVLGVDMDAEVVAQQVSSGRDVIMASALDADFWDRLQLDASDVHLVMLAMPGLDENRFATEKLKARGYTGRVAAIVKFAEDRAALESVGVDHVFNLYTEAGAGFASDVAESLELSPRALTG